MTKRITCDTREVASQTSRRRPFLGTRDRFFLPTVLAMGTELTKMQSASVEGLQLVTADKSAVGAELAGRGEEVSDVRMFDSGSFVFPSDLEGDR